MGCEIEQVTSIVLSGVGAICVLLIVTAVFICLLRGKPLSVTGGKLFLILIFVCLTFGVVPKSLDFFGMTAQLAQKDKDVAHARAVLAASTAKPASTALTEVVMDEAATESVADLLEDAGGEDNE